MKTQTHQTQQDHSVRIVALSNLRAMCARITGMAHRFEIVKVSRSRVHVEYSNPDEYGNPEPITAIYPCYPSIWQGDEDNPRVVLDALRYLGCTGRNEESWQAFWQLTDCPELFRSGPDADDWQSGAEIARQRLGLTLEYYWADGCTQYFGVCRGDNAGRLLFRRLFASIEECDAYVLSVFRGMRR